MRAPISKCKILIFGAAAFTILVVVMVLIWLFAFQTDKKYTGAVVTNGPICSDIGVSMLNKGGSVADAAIAALFCEGVSLPQSMGLGGGFLLTIYERDTGVVKALNSRETAPLAADENMFNGSSDLSSLGKRVCLLSLYGTTKRWHYELYTTNKGGLAVAVPGELKGYWYLHKEHGYLPWKDLVQPTIDLCRGGIYVTAFLARTYLEKVELLYKDPVLREIFIDPSTNSTYVEGKYIKRLRLAKTLEIIANEGADALYTINGTLTSGFVKDIQDHGGIITAEDMATYEPIWQEPVTTNFSDGTILYTSPLPGSGPVLAFMLNILDGFVDTTKLYSVNTYQKLVEAFKWGYGQRTNLGDVPELADFVNNLTSKSFAEQVRKLIFDDRTNQSASYYGANTVSVEDHGTANLVVLAPNGDAIAVTSTINLVFGAGFASDSTGIILNDEMDDFSSPNVTNSFGLPPSENNFIKPGKRPLSSMVPSLIIKDRDVILATGAAGGSKITTVIASVIIKHLWYDVHLLEAIDEKRLHHQLFPMMIEYEEGFETVYAELVQNLTTVGHESKYTPTGSGFSAVTAITTKDGVIQGAFDERRGGYISYTES